MSEKRNKQQQWTNSITNDWHNQEELEERVRQHQSAGAGRAPSRLCRRPELPNKPVVRRIGPYALATGAGSSQWPAFFHFLSQCRLESCKLWHDLLVIVMGPPQHSWL